MTEFDTEHRIDILAPAEQVYAALADVTRWPNIFPPTVHAQVLEQAGGQQRIRLWATANHTLKRWESLRLLNPEERAITFRQTVSAPPVAAMSGTWRVASAGPDSSEVTLRHRCTPDGSQGAREWIEAAVEANSTRELAALKVAAETVALDPQAVLSFRDTVWIDAPPRAVHEFIARAERWPQHLPHVSAVRLEEPEPAHQLLGLDTAAPDGSVHTTTSWRVLLDPPAGSEPDRGAGDIVYKQVELPALLALHTGRWTFSPEGGGTAARSSHTVSLRPDSISAVLGAGKSIEDGRAFIRQALGGNSRATLNVAKRLLEQRPAAVKESAAG